MPALPTGAPAPLLPKAGQGQGQGRSLVAFAALSACYFAHMGFFGPYLPLWLKDQGLGLYAISLLASVQSLTRLLAPYAWGAISDHTGERVKLLRWVACIALLCSFGLWFNPAGPLQTAGLAWITAVLFLMFMHTSAMSPMNEAALTQLVSQGGQFDNRRYGQVRVWGSVGFLVTVVAAGNWFERFGMAQLPHITSLMLLMVVACTLALPNQREVVVARHEKLPIWPVVRQPEVAWFFASTFFHVLAHIAVYAFLSLYLDALGYGKTVIGLLWALGVVVEIAWFYTQGRWLPRLPMATWLLLCAGVMVVRMGLTAGLASFLPILILAQALHAVTFATHHAACIAVLAQHFPGHLRGRGQGLFSVIAYGVPGILGGVAGGAISSRMGLASVFWAAMAMASVAMLCAWRFGRLQKTGFR